MHVAFITAVLTLALTNSSCGTNNVSSRQVKIEGIRTVNSPPASDRPQPEDPIRSVDFKNFTYPVCPSIRREVLPKTKNILLVGGSLEVPEGSQGNKEPIAFNLSNVTFTDLTGDGSNEAVVTITHLLYPHGFSGCTYVYSWKEEPKPRLLWQHESGSGAFGGLRRLDIEDGFLVVEEYEPSGTMALCCPEKLTRSFYKWDGRDFKEIKSSTLPNESKRMDPPQYP